MSDEERVSRLLADNDAMARAEQELFGLLAAQKRRSDGQAEPAKPEG